MTELSDQEVSETAEAYDEEDVPQALARNTEDGRGDDVVPKSDFNSYQAGENVTAYTPESSD